MDEITVPLVKAESLFNLHGPQFIVTGPTPDAGVQLLVCDDFIATPSIRITAPQPGAPATMTLDSTSFERVIFGRIKLSLDQAKELANVLQHQVAEVEKLIAQNLQAEAQAGQARPA